MAEIRLPENKNKDTHNLGKHDSPASLRFQFLGCPRPQKQFFPIQHLDLSKTSFSFLKLNNGRFLSDSAARRRKKQAEISFKKHGSQIKASVSSIFKKENEVFDRSRCFE